MDSDDIPVERKLDELRLSAASSGETELLDMFSSEYLLGMLSGDFIKATPALVLDSLRTSVRTRLELHRLEQDMDHSVFRNLVTSGYLARSGRDKDTGEVVFWFSVNALIDRRIEARSPKGKAYVRAQLWLFETICVQTINRHGLGGTTHSLCLDLQGGLLDFNARTTEHVLRLVHDVFPIQSGIRVYYFGVPKIIPWVLNCAYRMIPECAETVRVMEDYEDALDIVENPDDVPEFWLSEDAPRDKYANARTSTWCYERCLSDTNKITTKDLFNPNAWPYSPDEEYLNVAKGVEKMQGHGGLEVIDETDEENVDSRRAHAHW